MNKPNDGWYEGKGEFLRKGVVGDWISLFTPPLTQEYDAWIREQLIRLRITDPKIAAYYQLQN